MSLDDLVSVNITATTVFPSRPGFGTPMIAAYHNAWSDRIRAYSKAADMLTDGFLVTDPAYKAAAVAFSQNPTPSKVKIGRRALKPVDTVTLTCTSAVAGDKYTIQVNGTSVSYTVPSSSSTTAVATAIAALIDADPIAAATASSAVITVTVQGSPTPSNSYLNDFKNWSSNFQVQNTTADPGIATDLAAIYAVDPDWYGLGLDSEGKAEIEAAAAWVETNKRLYSATTSDYDCGTSGSSDVLSQLKASAYARTGVWYSGSQLRSYLGVGILSQRFTTDPGGDTWAFKTVAGVPADTQPTTLSETALGYIIGKNGNAYYTMAGLNMTQNGMTASGEFFDLTRFVDWLQAQIQIDVFGLLASLPKVPYTDLGADMVASTIKGSLALGVKRGGLASDPAPTVSVPQVSSQSIVDRGNRNMPGVTFSGRLAGAVHKLSISGTVAP